MDTERDMSSSEIPERRESDGVVVKPVAGFRRFVLTCMPTGLQGKLVLILVVLTVSAVMISSGHARYKQRLFVLERAQQRAVDDLGQVGGNIRSVLQWVLRDLLVLRDLPQLRSLLEAETDSDRGPALRDVERAFFSLADHHRIFHQVRFLDAHGRETVRVNFGADGAHLVPVAQLQDKGDRYYFQESIRLDHGQVYISPFDLNVEQGEIERPFVPAIRFATPVVDRQGNKRGVIVLNVLGSAVLHQLESRQRAGKHGERYYLLNRDGYYLYHPDQTRTFGFMFDVLSTIGRDEPGLGSWIGREESGMAIRRSVATGKKTLFAFRRIPVAPVTLPVHAGADRFPAGPTSSGIVTDYWVLLTAVDDAELLVGFREYVRSFLPFTLLLLVLCVVVATLVAQSMSRPVVSLARAAGRIQDGDLSARATIYTRDEMGTFGRQFNAMAAKLEHSITMLRQSEAKYRRIFENARDCIFVTDRNCRIIDLNDAGRELLGIAAGVEPGRLTMDCCAGGGALRDVAPVLEQCLDKSGYVKEFETRLTRPDGETRTCLLTASGRYDESGHLVGFEGILRDITARRRQEEVEREFRKRLQEEIVLAEERERRHIGQVLHEEMAQDLALVNLKLREAEQGLCPVRQAEGREEAVCVSGTLGRMRQLVGRMIIQIRSMIFDLYPVILDDQGLVAAMHWYGDNFRRRTGITVTIYDSGRRPRLSRSREIYLFRAFKELIHNAWKHAGISEVVVTVKEKAQCLRLIVDDDGAGFDPAEKLGRTQAITGIGLFAIRQWTTTIGGTMAIESEPGRGVRVVIEVPLEKSGEEETSS